MAPGPGPVQEGLPVLHLVFQRADEALGGGVIPVNRGRGGGVGARSAPTDKDRLLGGRSQPRPAPGRRL
jgi:hypothetical protein